MVNQSAIAVSGYFRMRCLGYSNWSDRIVPDAAVMSLTNSNHQEVIPPYPTVSITVIWNGETSCNNREWPFPNVS
jgi:hypothetical protein